MRLLSNAPLSPRAPYRVALRAGSVKNASTTGACARNPLSMCGCDQRRSGCRMLHHDNLVRLKIASGRCRVCRGQDLLEVYALDPAWLISAYRLPRGEGLDEFHRALLCDAMAPWR